MNKVKKLLTAVLLLVSTAAFSQTVKLKGLVLDETGAPLPGASIIDRSDPGKGVVTDLDGRFSIQTKTGARLTVSFVGYVDETIVVKSGSNDLEISLQVDKTQLEDVIVIGYGSVKKSDLTYSVAKVTEESFKNRPITTVGDALQGNLAGVRVQAPDGLPGQEMTIRVRGTNTINGDSSPLYVIDGIPCDSMEGLSPADISSLQVLKDAAATSIYGARGGNGVILIETKQGVSTKPVVTFNASYGFQEREKKMEMMSGEEYVAYYSWLRNVKYLRTGGSLSDPMASRGANYQIPDYWLTKTEFTDWQDEVFRIAPMSEYNVSAQLKHTYGSTFFSAGHMEQQGVLLNSSYQRTNVRLNQIVKLGKNLTIGLNFNFMDALQEGAGASEKEASLHHALQVTPLMDIDEGTVEWGFPENVGMTYPNPKVRLESTKSTTRQLTLGASAYAQYRFTKYLNFKTQYSYNYSGKTYEYFVPANVAYNNSYVSTGSSYNSTNNKWTWQNTLTYDREFNKTHKLNVVLGQSCDESRNLRQDLAATGWPYEYLQTLNLANTATTASTTHTVRTSASLFGRASYSLKDRYLLTASLRYDGSSRFGSNYKWGWFPSVSAGWKINEEEFLESASWLDLLKLRASWGRSGNDRIGDYVYFAMLSNVNTTFGEQKLSGLAPANIPNDNLRWERTASTNLGFDFSAFKNRIQLNVDVYYNYTDNLLFNVTVPYTSGFSTFTDNVGSIMNAGWEIDLTTHNVAGRKFNWSTSFNFSGNTNEVLDMGGQEEIIVNAYDAYFITKVGGPVSQFYCLTADGLLTADDFEEDGTTPLVPVETGQRIGNVKYVDQNGDGEITEADYVCQGSNLPDFIYGITNKFSYGNLSLSVLLQGQVGGKVMFLGQRQYDNGGSITSQTNQLRHWLRSYKEDFVANYGENPELVEYTSKYGIDMSWDGVTPNMYSGKNDNNDTRRIYDSTYLRIKNITLTYDFPQKWFKGRFFKGISCYLSADNVWTFSDYPGFTVETNSFGNNTTMQGVDYSTYPLARKVMLGATFNF